MNKRIQMTARPLKANTADQWVETSLSTPVQPAVKFKRLTVDVDPELHTRLRLRCVRRDEHISDWLRALMVSTLDAEDAGSSST
ncbi:hypothetical protein Pan44_51720 [Caulifigura coniformis]|uniref:ParG n=1 Tax=Caulifigura coniformis TaxID=2527983 RepID=A0A517SLV1_9PLAN|nr:plasmid partition protein ParG [Caulifigura coniformis]QDT57106.1 hypothetical protein Pan44_51720 [Caulifigura coniformis]